MRTSIKPIRNPEYLNVQTRDLEIAIQNIHHAYHNDDGGDKITWKTWKTCNRPACHRIRETMIEAGYTVDE